MEGSALEAGGGGDPSLIASQGPIVFTIGHGLIDRQEFIGLLQRFGVELVVDVRSEPYSGRAPQFNRERLEGGVGRAAYRWMPELGGRPPEHLRVERGAPDYERMADEPSTRRALDDVAALAATQTIALMCSESRPEDCHRSRMLEPQLAQRGVWIEHILHSGEAVAEPTLFA